MKHIVSDMGGVLINLQWQENVQKLLGKPIEMNALHHLWVNASSVSGFEKGKIQDFDEFTRLFKKEFQLPQTHEEIQYVFMQLIQDPKKGCYEVLEELKKHYSLSILSNTNPPHVDFIKTNYKKLLTYFEHLFFSYQIGLIKPHKEMYQYILDCLKTDASNVYFFDDGLKNIEVAASMGINAFRVDSPQEILAIMKGTREEGMRG